MKSIYLSTLALFFAWQTSLAEVGNDHGHGVPTPEGAEQLPGLPHAEQLRDLLIKTTSVAPEAGNALLDALDVCDVFKTDNKSKDGFYAEVFFQSAPTQCRILLYSSYFADSVTDQQRIEMELHELVHFATRFDERLSSSDADVYIQAIAKGILKDSPGFYLTEHDWKFAAPTKNFFNLPLEKIVSEISQAGSLQMPAIAKELNANSFQYQVLVQESSQNLASHCRQELFHILSVRPEWTTLDLPTDSSAQISANRYYGTKITTSTSYLDDSHYDAFITAVISDAARLALREDLAQLQNAQVCEVNVYATHSDRLQGKSPFGYRSLVIFPEYNEEGKDQWLKPKILLIRYEYSQKQ